MELTPSSSESRSSKATPLGLLDPEEENTMILRNIRKYPSTKPHPVRLESSATPPVRTSNLVFIKSLEKRE
jgi:hypothetical protein